MKNALLFKLNAMVVRSARLSVWVFALIVFSSFQPAPSIHIVDDEGSKLTSLHSAEFTTYVNTVYFKISLSYTGDSAQFIERSVLEKGLRGYTYLKHTDQLSNPRYLTIVDFSRFCNDKRMWVIDMDTKSIVYNERVAHGARTGDEYAKYFSNKHSSHKSSLGFYSTGGTYHGSKKYSLKLNGLEKGFNTNAFARGIVIHGADYVSDRYLEYSRRIGRSFGCPAVSPEVNTELINLIKGGSCLFIYHPTNYYLEKSTIMNGNLYMTVDELNS